MNKRNRERLLNLARWFDRCALRIRAYAKSKTPRRKIVS